MRAVVRWGIVDRLTGRRRRTPPGPGAPRVEPDLGRILVADGRPRLTWIGHAGFLLAAAGWNVLIDPVFSMRIGAFYRRYVPPGLAPSQLPAIDVLLISHAHYDHLDAPSVGALDRRVAVVVPEGLGRWFRRRGFARVQELRWWERVDLGPLAITLTPARHWSKRTPFDTNRKLWGGFVVKGGGLSVYHAGDTAMGEHFVELAARFPALDAALLPIGAYDPPWFMEYNHMSPEQAGEAFLTLGARRLVPMHWGSFRLTDEPLAEPAERLRAWWQRRAPAGRELALLEVGRTLDLEG
ncbi:MAG: MBL fold metallo-hydrolase [Acidobacteria bacterium]|nr:MAG: MBL fold metallo-hydrolase [Acidobacteriota bacterium]